MSDTSDTVGYGQQQPWDGDSDLNAVAFLVRQIVAEIDTMKLVQVQVVHGGGLAPPGTVDVLPLVTQIDGSGNSTPHGTVYGIPWSRLQGGKNAIICDPQVDDIGYVVAADRDTSNVRASRKQATPGSRRRHDIADGVYAGWCLNVAPDQYLQFTATGIRLVDKNGNSAELSDAGVTVVSPLSVTAKIDNTRGFRVTPTEFTIQFGSNSIVVNATNTTINGPLNLNGQATGPGGTVDFGASHVTTLGEVTAGGIGLTTHHHTQPPDSHGDAEGPTSAAVA